MFKYGFKFRRPMKVHTRINFKLSFIFEQKTNENACVPQLREHAVLISNIEQSRCDLEGPKNNLSGQRTLQ